VFGKESSERTTKIHNDASVVLNNEKLRPVDGMITIAEFAPKVASSGFGFNF